jgi:2-polyprenyl-6-hydroxyphenyl methylase/3-demethylubiquinone-9 3-methyltransferase
MANPASNASPEETARFERLAAQWRDPMGPMRPLHVINPLRVAWILDTVRAARAAGEEGAAGGRRGGDSAGSHTAGGALAGLAALDVGCGGGLLAEPLRDAGAEVTGIDVAARNVAVARQHAAAAGRAIEYRVATAEDLEAEGARFDLVAALEVVEHVPDRPAFLGTLAHLVRPGGFLFLSTINRTALSWALAIVAAERVLGVLPRGTHRWDWFVTPEEAEAALGGAGMRRIDLRGLRYLPVLHRAAWTRGTAVNWAGAWRRPARPGLAVVR